MRESSSSSFLPQLLLKLMINNFHCFAFLGVGLGEDDVIGLDEGEILVIESLNIEKLTFLKAQLKNSHSNLILSRSTSYGMLFISKQFLWYHITQVSHVMDFS